MNELAEFPSGGLGNKCAKIIPLFGIIIVTMFVNQSLIGEYVNTPLRSVQDPRILILVFPIEEGQALQMFSILLSGSRSDLLPKL